MSPIVLGVTHSGDPESFERLERALQARGARLFRLDTDLYPTRVQLHAALGHRGYEGYVVNQQGERVALDALRSVWVRRLHIAHQLPRQGLDPSVRRACWREATAAMLGILSSLPVPIVDDPHRVARAEVKPWQWQMAREAGLRVIPTLVSNAEGAARRWVAQAPPLITKMLAAGEVDTPEGKGRVSTTALEPGDLEDLSGLTLAPLTLQHRVYKALEVRAVVVGERVFAAGVDSRAVAGAEVDWRRASAALAAKFRPVDLPAELCAALVRLNAAMGLRYGGADLVLTPEGEWFFLEINPGGDWAWLDALAGMDVAGALADLLLQ